MYEAAITDATTAKKILQIIYTNYRGETSLRKIIPEKVWFGETDWHPEPQWLLDAFDVEKQGTRSFALKEVRTVF